MFHLDHRSFRGKPLGSEDLTAGQQLLDSDAFAVALLDAGLWPFLERSFGVGIETSKDV